MNIVVISLFEKQSDPNGIYINTTSKSETDWQLDLSPFHLGPCKLYWNAKSLNMENAWQYSKVYREFDNNGEPKKEYVEWAFNGWNNPRAVRYPMGKGIKPVYSWWAGYSMDYVTARKCIYIPLYTESVIKTNGYKKLCDIYNDPCNKNKTLYLRDYDAYRHKDLNMTLGDVVNNKNKKCGHAFVLAILLTNDWVLNECKRIS